MFCELITLSTRAGALRQTLTRLEPLVAGPALLGCWYTILGNVPRIFVLQQAQRAADLPALSQQARENLGIFQAGDLVGDISIDHYATLPCLPNITPGRFGAYYEIRSYELQPQHALQAALTGWASVIDTRLGLAPITTVMHSVNGLVPRLIHIYPYQSLAHRREIRDKAIASGQWPPKGGAQRNQVMRTEITVPASFSPLY